MTYRSVWWHTPVEYGSGVCPQRTWPLVQEQYRRPTDSRRYDLPVEKYDASRLYQRFPKIGVPEYRGLFRDKPPTVASYYPESVEDKPTGFHGRMYYEHGTPLKYKGRTKNDLYWLEQRPYLPQYSNASATQGLHETTRGLNLPPASTQTPCPPCNTLQTTHTFPGTSSSHRLRQYSTPRPSSYNGNTSVNMNRMTMDGVGYL